MFLDTNIIIYHLYDTIDLESYIKSYDQIYYSFISKIELLSFPDLAKEEGRKAKDLIQAFSQVMVNDEIVDEAIMIRKKYGLKVPDSIIVASTMVCSAGLFTNDGELKKKISEINIMTLDE